ncbi:glycoside hydrolase family 3 protein [Pseudoramibacter sp.]|jgi:beta-N-acetylhexosaminidase|uniref:glycoside hydrolase family 3 protein n=1 Tax=Pseudoramibacter sp. TaxID=2034862 RepID=UPI0025D2A83A|nr:glycoside hydrolase family 3 N-terminal domain-containing protein [Pseudoramibacter sp.]MCH4071674.1 glycoside hydrolase family 3 protein [Pseudoramibacter sp.]MCH4105442.1 glycoside hydrolase family 3 protein [Pseudoramibacter sp.]
MQNNTKPRSPRLLVLILFAAAIAAAALGTFFFAFCHITEKAPVTPPKKADPIAVQVKHMTTEEKVGQLFIVTPDQLTGSHVTAADAATREAIAKTQPGGLIYFDDNLKNPAQTQALLKDTRKIYNDLGLPVPFLAVDEEGGEVARVAHNPAFGVQNVGDMRAVGRTGNPAKAAAVGTTLGTYLKGLGFNLDFAPDADVLTNPANTVVARRSFGTDPALVKQMSEAEARALSACGVLPCLKHFPGHGATTGDTHTGTAATDKTLDQMMQAELVPFNDVNAYAPMIMAGHIAAPKVTGDNTPACLSHKMVTDVLRGKLHYRGVITTDSLQMGAVTQSEAPGQAAVSALEAGCDVILMPDDFPAARAAVLAAVQKGTLSEKQLNASVTRILKCKAQLKKASN